MKLPEVKVLAAAVIVISLATTNFIIPAVLEDAAPLRVTAISKPSPVEMQTVPEPVRVLSPAQVAARAATHRAHADQILAENGELPSEAHVAPDTERSISGGVMKCVAGC